MSWLLQFCAARAAFATLFTAWSATLPLLKSDWALSASQAGMVQSAYHVGFLTSLFVVGFLSDRYGARRVYLLSSVAAVISGLMFALLSDGFVSALLLYGLTGLCSGGSYTPGLAILAQREGERRGRAMGLYLAAASFGYMIGLLIASVMVPLAGWRGAFVVSALGPVVGMALGFWTLRHVPNVVHPVTGSHGNRGALIAVVQNRPAMLSIWGYTFHAWELLGLWAWLPAFLAIAAQAAGSADTEAASLSTALTALTYLVAVAGSIVGGTLSDSWGRTTVILATSLTSLACSFAFGWMIGLPLWAVVLVAVLYNMSGVADSSIHSTVLTELMEPSHLGMAYSLRSALGFGAGAVAPWVFGLVLDWGQAAQLDQVSRWGLAWASLGLGGILGPVATWRLRQHPAATKLAGGRR